MSIKIMTLVWDGLPASGSELLCMLAMADWANDDGGSVHPSMRAIAEKIRVSEKQARRIVQGLVEAGYMSVVGNQFGGAPGTTKQWVINVRKLRELAAQKQQEIDQRAPAHVTPPASVTPPIGGSPTTIETPPMGVPDPSHGCPQTPPMGVPDGSHGWEPNHHRTTNRTTNEPLQPAAPTAPAVVEAETELQAACRATWAAYAQAYAARYGAAPVRNAAVNAKVKQFVQRLGYVESPGVATFFVMNVNDPFVVRNCHPLGTLLQSAEAYRTQWATGRTAEAFAAPAETAYQRSMRERMQEAAPSAARRDPSHPAQAADYFNAIEVPTRTVEQLR